MPAKTSAPHSPETLREIKDRIEETSARLEQVAKEMEKQGIGTLEVKEHANLVRGMKAIEGFSDQAVATLRAEREKRGHFGPFQAEGQTPRRSSRPPSRKA